MSDEELFDVVNDHDEVTGQRSRRDVHRLGLPHRAVHLFVFNRAGQIFLQKRSLSKDCFPGKWDSSASGHLDSGETYDRAVVRECREELGIRMGSMPEKLFKIDACPATGQEFVWLYRLFHEGPFVLQASEIETGDWYAPAEVDRWIQTQPGEFADAFVLLWRNYAERGCRSVAPDSP